LPLVGGANVIDVSRITARPVLGIHQMNDAVVGRRFAPAFMSPVATAIWKHACEVSNSSHARSGKARARVGVSPGVATVSGPKDKVDVVVGEATTAFIHPGDVHVTRSHITGDLYIANERRAACKLSCIGPSRPVVSGKANKQCATANIEIVP
jgi:hypothetical protein